MRRPWAGLAAAVVLLLAACGADPVPEPAPTPRGEQAPPSSAVDTASLPLALVDQPVLDPGWDQVPQALDGYLLGLAHPDGDEPLRFVAAADDGTVLWEAARPPSCTGFALSRAGDRPVAVLTDVAPGSGTVAETSASGYDLGTGELLWGPVSVPGPHQGPGTVFAAPAPGAALGSAGPRVVLDPATGEELVSEDGGAVVVGEYGGVVLTASDGSLTGTGDGTSWEVVLAELGLGDRPTALPGVAPPPGTALVGPAGADHGVLLDVATGEVLAENVRDAVVEPLSGTLVTLEDDDVVGHPAGGERWRRPADGMRLVAAGNVFAYLRSDTAVRAVNAVTGDDAVAYDAEVSGPAVPVLVTDRGATVLDGAELALVPAPREPDRPVE